MNIIKQKLSKQNKPIQFVQDRHPVTGSRKPKIEFDKTLKLTSFCSVIGREDHSLFTVELTEEEVCDLYERMKDKLK